MERFKGKNVLITGASSGIGQAIAVRFARDGANVAINYRSGAEQAEATQVLAKAARSNGGGREIIVQADVSNEEQVKQMFATDHRGVRQPRHPGQQRRHSEARRPATKSRPPISTACSRSICAGPFLCSREAIRHFLSRPGGGVILNNSSVHEIIPEAEIPAATRSARAAWRT